MKKSITRALVVAIVALTSLTASAGPFQFGVIVGANINRFTTDKSELLSADNRAGFTGGLTAKFTVPIIGIGADVAVMYARRSAEMVEGENSQKLNYDYIAVPLHLRYDLGLPIVGKVLTPAIFTGPNFAFRCSKEIISDYKANKYNVGWDFGIALTFVNHVQIAGSYTLGMNKAINYVPSVNVADPGIKGRTSGWTVTAAYLF